VIRVELKKLAQHSAIYGAADVLPYIVNFFLLRVFTSYLTTADYGAFGILQLFAVVTKIFFRLGLDSGFFRIYYELDEDRSRKILATTLFATSLGVSVTLFFGCVLFSAPLGRFLLGSDLPLSSVRTWILLVAGDTVVNTFAFVPMNLFRIQGRARAFTAMTLFRSFLNIGLKLVLVVSGLGVTGVLLSDLISSIFFASALLPTLARNLAAGFSTSMLREAAAFGLPKVPHGLAHQILNLSDRKLIQVYSTLAESGLYNIGYTMGTGVKFFLSAFELAWAPFVYGQLRKPDAPIVLSKIATYAFAVLVGVGLANAIFGRELLWLMTTKEYHEAYHVIPVVVLAYVLQGVFALTSIGIGISKKTRYFPILTISAATLNVGLNVFWIPRYGNLGAAWSTVAGYGLMAGLGAYLGHREYPIPFDWPRLARVVLAASVSFAVSALAPVDWHIAVPVKMFAALLFPLGLWVSGFLDEDDIQAIGNWLRRSGPPGGD
jgi:O-antigen/teichoic acid export membrane protein